MGGVVPEVEGGFVGLADRAHDPEAELRLCMPLLGSLAVPDGGLLGVQRYAVALGVHLSKFVLSLWIPLVDRSPEPPDERNVSGRRL